MRFAIQTGWGIRFRWKNHLSILSMRFCARTFWNYPWWKTSFQFSLWDSDRMRERKLARIPSYFQFSLWDSCKFGTKHVMVCSYLLSILSMRFLRPWQKTSHYLYCSFNSLYEIPLQKIINAGVTEAITFNSLYEIHTDVIGRITKYFISTFNSLYEILHEYTLLLGKILYPLFQFSLWDSLKEVVG